MRKDKVILDGEEYVVCDWREQSWGLNKALFISAKPHQRTILLRRLTKLEISEKKGKEKNGS